MNNKDVQKQTKINIILFIGVIIAITILCIVIVFNRNQITIISSEIKGIDLLSDFSDYKKTEELTEEDKDDDYQKNYQQTSNGDENYLIKSAEWIDKEEGTAVITISGAQETGDEETTALYVATLCYAHGLSASTVISNITTLLEYYDNVDFIAINNIGEDGIVDVQTFTSESTTSEITSYITTTKSAGAEYPHYTFSIPVAIQKYLFGGYGDEYISTDNLINDPTAIYVSCDTMYLQSIETSDEEEEQYRSWGSDWATEKYFTFIEENYGDIYFTMSQTCQSDSSPTVIIRYPGYSEYDTNLMNILLGILNPENYGEGDLALSESSLTSWENSTSNSSLNLPFTDAKYAADYSYSKNFASAGVKVVTGTTITDTISDAYTITSVTVEDGSGNDLTYTINGNYVVVNDADYVSGDEITIKIYIMLNSDVVTNFDDFQDTNVGSATMSNTTSSIKLAVDSPKLLPTTSNYTVKYVDINTDEIIYETVSCDVAVGTNVSAESEIIDLDGYSYSSLGVDSITVTSDAEENIITIYYVKTSTVTIKYVDKNTDEEIIESVSTTYNEGDTYTTEYVEIAGYIYKSSSENTVGTVGREDIEVIYYYTTPQISITVSDEDIDENNYSTSDTVTYIVVADVPEYDDDSLLVAYQISDTLSGGFDLDTDSIVVYGDDTELTEGIEYTITFSSDGQSFVIDFDYDSISAYSQITLTYEATLTEYMSVVIGETGNPNEATLTYTKQLSDGNTELATDTDIITIYTYGIEIFQNEDSDIISGEEYSLYDGDEILYFILIDGIYYLATADNEGATTILIPDSDGNIYIYGLDVGTYILKRLSDTEDEDDEEIAAISVNDDDSNGTLDSSDSGIYEFTLPDTGQEIDIIAFIGIVCLLWGISMIMIILKMGKERRDRYIIIRR